MKEGVNSLTNPTLLLLLEETKILTKLILYKQTTIKWYYMAMKHLSFKTCRKENKNISSNNPNQNIFYQ